LDPRRRSKTAVNAGAGAKSQLSSLVVAVQRQGKRLVLAREVGQVGDILATERGPSAIEFYPSVRAAVDALRAERQDNADR
jgi:hypothetical protein